MKIRLLSFVLLLFGVFSAAAQSSNVEFPTPVTTDSISGKIKARDIGDPRSTIYYYAFEATQGDVLLKIEASNLNGDIDVFYADNLRPLTKITVFADISPSSTNREFYLRKFEKLILKIEGRTPNDEPAVFSIKFEGSFQKMIASKDSVPADIPEVKTDKETDPEIKVNSVGTIIETKPKPTPTPRATVAKNGRRTSPKTTTPEAVSTIKTPKTTPKKDTKPKAETTQNSENETGKKTEVIITDNLPKTDEVTKAETAKEDGEVKESETAKAPEKAKTTKKKSTTTRKNTTAKKETPAKKEALSKKETEANPAKTTPAADLAKALENIRLIVDFKDGAKIEKPMSELVRFGVDKGILTIIYKDGSIARYSILEITKISVE